MAPVLFVRLLIEIEKKDRDCRADMSGKSCPVSWLLANLIAVSDLHKYRLGGK